MKKKLRKYTQYCERQEHMFNSLKTTYKAICHNCRKVFNFVAYDSEKICSECGSNDIIHIGPIARLPRKNASKQRWDEFWKHCGKTCAGACR